MSIKQEPRSESERIVPMRLQRYLARCGAASRRGSENLMSAGRVRVNGKVVTELGSKVDPLVDLVTVDGIAVSLGDKPVFIVFNKPADVMVTMSDPHARRCIPDVLPCDRWPGIFPVGRLDKDTTGLLLLTTDGALANRMLHPRHHVNKRYIALVEGLVEDRELQPLREGIHLDDGVCKPADCSCEAQGLMAVKSFRDLSSLSHFQIRHAETQVSLVKLDLQEGRKHQVKRMLSAIGHEVIALHRSSFGPFELGDLNPGAWREARPDEIEAAQAY